MGCDPLHVRLKAAQQLAISNPGKHGTGWQLAGQSRRRYLVFGTRYLGKQEADGDRFCDPLLNGSPGMEWPFPAMSGDEWE